MGDSEGPQPLHHPHKHHAQRHDLPHATSRVRGAPFFKNSRSKRHITNKLSEDDPQAAGCADNSAAASSTWSCYLRYVIICPVLSVTLESAQFKGPSDPLLALLSGLCDRKWVCLGCAERFRRSTGSLSLRRP